MDDCVGLLQQLEPGRTNAEFGSRVHCHQDLIGYPSRRGLQLHRRLHRGWANHGAGEDAQELCAFCNRWGVLLEPFDLALMRRVQQDYRVTWAAAPAPILLAQLAPRYRTDRGFLHNHVSPSGTPPARNKDSGYLDSR